MGHEARGTEPAGHLAELEQEEPAGEERKSVPGDAGLRNLLTVVFWCLFVLGSFSHQETPDSYGSELAPLWLLLMWLAAYLWFVCDAKSRQFKPDAVMHVGVLLMLGLFIPIYLVQCRGWGGLFIWAGKFFGILLVPYVALSALDVLLP